jgi:hypothetical protein
VSGRDEGRAPDPTWTAEEPASLLARLCEWAGEADAAAFDDLPQDSGDDPAGSGDPGPRPSRFG